MPATASKSQLQTTTVRLPRRLYESAREVLEEGWTEASSFNELLVESLENRLKELRRARIDSEFGEMKNDAFHRRESATMARQFATNDRDTLRSAEKAKK
jgi:hypothetical protein